MRPSVRSVSAGPRPGRGLLAALLSAALLVCAGAPLAPPVLAQTPPSGTITLQAPPPGTTITSPVTVTGRASVAPPSGALVASVFDRAGRLIGQEQVPNGGGDFTARLPFAVSDLTPGRIEVAEYRVTDAYTLTTSGVVVTMTVPTSTWLDQAQAPNWNGVLNPVPQAPATTPVAPNECAARERSPRGAEEQQVSDAGWRLFGDPPPAAESEFGGLRVVLGQTAYDGTCRPMGYNQFVFAEGATYVGTISPAPMDSRKDGAGSIDASPASDTLTATYSRYAAGEPDCCPGRLTTITYRVDRGAARPLLTPGGATTGPAGAPPPPAPAPAATPAPAAPEAPPPSLPACAGLPAAAEGVQLCLPPGVAGGMTGARVARNPNQEPEAREAHRVLTLQGYPVASPRSDAPSISVFDLADFDRPGAQNAANVQALRALLTQRPAFSGVGAFPQGGPNLPGFTVEGSTPFLARPVYVDLPWGTGVRGVGQTGQDYLPTRSGAIQYLFAGLSADGRWLVTASFPLGAPDIPAIGEEAARRDPAASIAAVHRHLSLLDEARYTPQLASLDDLLRTLAVQGP
jgi:hypothetical protein